MSMSLKIGLCMIILGFHACGFQKDPDMTRQSGTQVPEKSHGMKIDATSTPVPNATPSPHGSVMPRASPGLPR